MDSAGLLSSKAGTSDPFVTLTLGDQTEKTSVLKGTLTPVWKQRYHFVADNAAEPLVIQVDDYDALSGADFMGAAVVPHSAFSHGPTRRWVKLTDRKGREDKDRGEVELFLRHVHNPELALEDDAPDDLSKPANEIRITLIRAKDLPVMDAGLIGKGSSDPLVEFSADGEKATSSVKKKTLSPMWREKFALQAEDGTLNVDVYDYDAMSGNDLIGRFDVPLSSLADRQPHREWHEIAVGAGLSPQ